MSELSCADEDHPLKSAEATATKTVKEPAAEGALKLSQD